MTTFVAILVCLLVVGFIIAMSLVGIVVGAMVLGVLSMPFVWLWSAFTENS